MHLKKTGNRLTFLLDIWNVRERKHTLKWKHIRWCKITTGLWASNVFCPTSVRNPGASEVTRHSHKGFFFNSMCKERGNTKINPSQSWIVHHTITHKPNNKKGKSYPCNRPWRAIGLRKHIQLKHQLAHKNKHWGVSKRPNDWRGHISQMG